MPLVHCKIHILIGFDYKLVATILLNCMQRLLHKLLLIMRVINLLLRITLGPDRFCLQTVQYTLMLL